MDNRSTKLEIYLAALLPIYIGVYILYASILLTFITPITSISKDDHFQIVLPPFNRAHLPFLSLLRLER